MRLGEILFACFIGVALAITCPLHAADAPATSAGDTPRVIIKGKSAAIVAYQLKRLNDLQLLSVERDPADPDYKPVYEAILTRKGMDRVHRQEAVDALAKLNKSDVVVELLNGIGKVDPEDKATLRDLVAMLASQKPAALAAQRDKIQTLATSSENLQVKQVAYGLLAAADGKPDAAWKLASETPDGLKALLGGISTIADPKVRAAFYPLVQPLLTKAPDEATRVAAIEAISYVPGHEADTFSQLAAEIEKGSGAIRAAAVRSIQRIPAASWPKSQLEPLAKAVIDAIEKTPVDQRTQPDAVQAVQLGNDLAAALPPAQGLPIRKQLRALGVQIIVIHTIREQMLYDLRYFVVQAGKPVQIVLQNEDSMPHNFVLTIPGLANRDAVLTAGMAVLPTGTEGEKAFVPKNDKRVVEATPLVQPDESATLVFAAPAQPGEYPFVCSFPGHAIRMYGTMLVVKDIDAYDAHPTVPIDPITGKPYTSQKNDAGSAPPPPAMSHEHP